MSPSASMLRKADEAVYARRAAAVDEERKIKEKELNSDLVLEQQRKELIVLQGQNALQEAENRGAALERDAQSRARATEMELAPLRALEPRTLLAVGLRELGQNADRVGNLTITSEMLLSTNGIGAFVQRSQESFHVSSGLAGIVAIALVGLLLNTGLRLIEERLLFWHYRSRIAQE